MQRSGQLVRERERERERAPGRALPLQITESKPARGTQGIIDLRDAVVIATCLLVLTAGVALIIHGLLR